MPVNTVFSIPRKEVSLKDNIEGVIMKLKHLMQCTYNLNDKSADKKSEFQDCLAILKEMVNKINKVDVLGSKSTIRPTIR